MAAAIRETHVRAWPTSSSENLRQHVLSSFYMIQAKSEDAEARAAAHLVSEVAERLRRLGDAYGEWNPFDASAYFDLTDAQTARLVHIEERVNTVHVAFFVDPLLPSFYKAESFWANHFFPAYHAAHPGKDLFDENSRRGDRNPNGLISGKAAPKIDADSPSMHKPFDPTSSAESKNGQDPDAHQSDSAFTLDFANSIFPEMVERWHGLIRVGQQARRILADHIGYLAVNGSQEERSTWRAAWMQPSPVMATYIDVSPDYRTLPTLSLSIEFPLPVYRQPGRQQRLRLNRQRRRGR